jgi:tetratricopeptide (TPR) repeat protein
MAQQPISVAEAARRLKAGEQLATVFGISEEQVQAVAMIACHQYEQGKLENAEKLFGGVTAMDDTYSIGYAGLGAVAMAKKPPDLATAFTNLSKAVELNPNDATVQANLGEVLLRQGKLEEAKPHLEKAFQLDPERKDRSANRARAIVAGLDMVIKEVQKRAEPAQRAKAS